MKTGHSKACKKNGGELLTSLETYTLAFVLSDLRGLTLLVTSVVHSSTTETEEKTNPLHEETMKAAENDYARA